MKRAIIVTFVGLVAWQVYGEYRAGAFVSLTSARPAKPAAMGVVPEGGFKCDERTVCSQMTSCAEAKYFQKHCPDLDLRPDSAGLPCTTWWCTSPGAP